MSDSFQPFGGSQSNSFSASAPFGGQAASPFGGAPVQQHTNAPPPMFGASMNVVANPVNSSHPGDRGYQPNNGRSTFGQLNSASPGVPHEAATSRPIANSPFATNTSRATGAVAFGSSGNIVTTNTQGGRPPAFVHDRPNMTQQMGLRPAHHSEPTRTWESNAREAYPSSANNAHAPFGSSVQERTIEPAAIGDRVFVRSKPVGQVGSQASRITHGNSEGGNGSNLNSDEAQLKAKIEEKKRLYAEKKKKMLEKRERENRDNGPHVSLGAGRTTTPPPPPPSQMAVSSSRRQAQSSSGNDHGRPGHGRGPVKSTPLETSQPGSDKHEREDLKDAVSLVGTCVKMCPDDELQRREREGDIQHLEVPQPGTLHPKNWTLHDTAVKRFRRSAADYKLDVPEWVRPPDVLERVCSYLEEWIMERDRQGPDPRFPQGQTPPQLDVYQFMWDRTRMIRKDFTLQNYVGTGGNCDARAVRCHERIARWHVMCEHQLCHLEDFVVMQSQQNIQELGQTMKTLNQFYDDSLNRATIEVPGKDGRETRQQATWSYQCAANIVQGKNPVDYDGSPLNNTAHESFVQSRCIGDMPVNAAGHGTSEPEMRGLYILLTMNNEGGMEVLKYASKLFRERPTLYHSQPVQLALKIFKAKKDFNYARFFSILKAPTTPYLFSCIMFKHVETMRKVAFRIMSKTFGARKKDTRESIYDAYPLPRLMDLLCFEDIDEARSACKHFNITVKHVNVRSSTDAGRQGTVEIVFWRQTDFRESKDPKKGTTLPLHPKKMIKTIERKLGGATRLAVCRGQSGTLSPELIASQVPSENSITANETSILTSGRRHRLEETAPVLSSRGSDDEVKVEALLQQQRIEMTRLESLESGKTQSEQPVRIKSSVQKADVAAALNRSLPVKQAAGDTGHRSLDGQNVRNLQQGDVKETRTADPRVENGHAPPPKQTDTKRPEHRKQATVDKINAQKAFLENRKGKLAEAKLALENEAKAIAKKVEDDRRAWEHEEQERERLKAIQMERNRLKRAEEERQRKIMLQQRKIREKKIKEEEAFRLKESKRKAEEKEHHEEKLSHVIKSAQMDLAWRQWKSRSSRLVENSAKRMCDSKSIDPTFLHSPSMLNSYIRSSCDAPHTAEPMTYGMEPSIQNMLEASLRIPQETLDPAGIAGHQMIAKHMQPQQANTTTTHLLQIGLYLPRPTNSLEESMHELTKTWLRSRLSLGQESSWSHSNCNIRCITVFVSNEDDQQCNLTIAVIPPPWSTSTQFLSKVGKAQPLGKSGLRKSSVLLLRDNLDGGKIPTIGAATNPETMIVTNAEVTPESLNEALSTAFSCLMDAYFNHPQRVEVLSYTGLAATVIRHAMWRRTFTTKMDTGKDTLLMAKSVMLQLQKEIAIIRLKYSSTWESWPPKLFAVDKQEPQIVNYFCIDSHLPLNWMGSTDAQVVKSQMEKLQQLLNTSMQGAIDDLLFGCSIEQRKRCTELHMEGHHHKCLDFALKCFLEQQRHDHGIGRIYLPLGSAEILCEHTSRMLLQDKVTGGNHSRGTHDATGRVPAPSTVPNFGEEEIINLVDDDAIQATKTVTSKKRSAGNLDQNVIAAESKSRKKKQPKVRGGRDRGIVESAFFTKQLQSYLLGGDSADAGIEGKSLATLLSGRTYPTKMQR